MVRPKVRSICTDLAGRRRPSLPASGRGRGSRAGHRSRPDRHAGVHLRWHRQPATVRVAASSAHGPPNWPVEQMRTAVSWRRTAGCRATVAPTSGIYGVYLRRACRQPGQQHGAGLAGDTGRHPAPPIRRDRTGHHRARRAGHARGPLGRAFTYNWTMYGSTTGQTSGCQTRSTSSPATVTATARPCVPSTRTAPRSGPTRKG